MHSNLLFHIAVAIVAASVLGIVARWLRQPPILGYIAAGIVIGPLEGLGWVASLDIAPIAELGLILLLFMIGLEIDLKKLRKAGAGVVSVGIAQFALSVLLGLAFFSQLGLSGQFAPLYLAVGAALASTMIVVKLLYDKQELDSIAGRTTLGILVFQDLWAILFLALQHDLHTPQPAIIALSFAKAAGVVAFALGVSRFVLPVLFRSMARVPELLTLGGLAWCFLIALIADDLGLSLEMGALIAGVSISTFPYNLDVGAKVASLRDFFITLFFVSLGTQIARPDLQTFLFALAGAAFLIASRFVTISPILYLLRFGNRASFIPALNLTQISEFALVICTLGVQLGHIGPDVLTVVVLLLVITAVTSTYGIVYNHQIFERIDPLLRRLGLRDRGVGQEVESATPEKRIVFVGFTRYASSLLHELLVHDPSLANDIGVIDFNPQVKDELDRRGIQASYGDVSHLGTLHHAGVHHAKILICTVPDPLLKGTSNERLLATLLSLAPSAHVIVTAEVLETARELYRKGAAYVFTPRLTSVRELSGIVIAALEDVLQEKRREAIEQLEGRIEVLP